jgi:DNA-binding SARP family transcriptional activator
MELAVLGTIELTIEGVKRALGPPMVRAVLADLALNAGQTVATSQLIDDLWGREPPASATHTVQAYVSQLRRTLLAGGCPGVLSTSGPGYMLEASRSQVDAFRFSELLAQARTALAAGEADGAEGLLSSALSLWRGPALADIRDAAFAAVVAARLEIDRLVALEMLFDARLALGHDRELVSELETALADDPFREHLYAQLMTALYRGGRQADSLAVFQRAREALVHELGVEPGRELRELERAVLDQAPELELDRGRRRSGSVAFPVGAPGAAQVSANAVPGQLAALRPGGPQAPGRRKALRWGAAGGAVVFV